MTSLVLFLLRAVTGGLLIGHGGQKLFGWFGGHGLEGTAGWMASMRLEPARRWAILAGASEFGGGLLTVLGFLNPLGPIGAIAAMVTAWVKVHLGKPIWVTSGGAELPLVNIAVLTAIAVRGPGKLSLDFLLRLRIPRWLGLAAAIGAVSGVVLASRAEIEERTLLPQDLVPPADGDLETDPVLEMDDPRELEFVADVYDTGTEADPGVEIAATRRSFD
jgi:putative oxidoreductase